MERRLPDDVVQKITSFLPIKKAARVTLLSRIYTNSWRQNRNLCFMGYQGALPEHINNVMSQHSGPKLDRLALRLNAAGHEDRIHGWIQMAVAKGVEELDLDFSIGEQTISISSNLLDSESSNIRILELDFCNVHFSDHLIGLRFLKTLHFRSVPLTRSLMRSIMINCLALENLEIRDCEFQFGRLNIMAGFLKHFKKIKVEHYGENCTIFIYSSTLEELDYSGEICGFVFGTSMPNLRTVILTSLQSRRFIYIPRVSYVLGSIRYCTKLQICGKLIQGLFSDFSGTQYRHFHWQSSWLRDLTLCLNGTNIASTGTTSFINPCDIIYFLDNCPSLENLIMDLGEYPFGEGRFWKLEAKERFEMCHPQFRSLNSVFIRGFKYRNLEFQLLKMIVEHAPDLRCITLFQITDGDSTLEREACLEWMNAQHCSFDIQDRFNCSF